MRFAKIADNIEAYIKTPNEFDWKGIDTPNPSLIFSHKSTREKAADLSKLAKKTNNVELWIKDTSRSDISGVDTPGKAKSKETLKAKVIRKFKIVKKSEAEKLKAKAEDANAKDRENYKRDLDRLFKEGKISKEAYDRARLNAEKTEELVKAKEVETVKELAKAESPDVVIFSSPLTEGQHMPSEEEIYAEAVRMWQKENASARHEGFLPSTAPTRGELQEEGFLKQAQLSLMTSENTVASRKVMDYIGSLRGELEKIGFDIVPIAGFEL